MAARRQSSRRRDRLRLPDPRRAERRGQAPAQALVQLAHEALARSGRPARGQVGGARARPLPWTRGHPRGAGLARGLGSLACGGLGGVLPRCRRLHPALAGRRGSAGAERGGRRGRRPAPSPVQHGERGPALRARRRAARRPGSRLRPGAVGGTGARAGRAQHRGGRRRRARGHDLHHLGPAARARVPQAVRGSPDRPAGPLLRARRLVGDRRARRPGAGHRPHRVRGGQPEGAPRRARHGR